MQTVPKYSSIELLAESLGKLGYTSKPMVLRGSNYTQFVAPNGNVWLTSNTRIGYPFISSSATPISHHKDLAYELAESLGVTIPVTAKITKNAIDERVLDKMLKHAPLITKPNNSSLSRGLTLHIATKEELLHGLDYAFAYSDTALIQEQVSGEEIRFAVFDGEIRAALLRQTPRVVGDGRHTVSELIKAENKARKAIELPYISYPLLDKRLINFAAIDIDKVLAPGEVLELSRSTMIRGGASIYNVMNEVHVSYLETVQKLAKQLGEGFIVVDMLLQDYKKPQTKNNYAFIEFNKAPVLKLFYSCRDKQNFDVLKYLTPMLDKAIAGTNAHSQHFVGAFECVSLPEFGLENIIAKTDTGAYSGALHCVSVERTKTDTGKPMLRFALFEKPDVYYETENFDRKHVRSASGHRQQRYIIDTTIVMQGKTYPIKIGLSDRSKMKRPVLIGRRFLRENNMKVDVRINQELDDEGELSQ